MPSVVGRITYCSSASSRRTPGEAGAPLRALHVAFAVPDRPSRGAGPAGVTEGAPRRGRPRSGSSPPAAARFVEEHAGRRRRRIRGPATGSGSRRPCRRARARPQLELAQQVAEITRVRGSWLRRNASTRTSVAERVQDRSAWSDSVYRRSGVRSRRQARGDRAPPARGGRSRSARAAAAITRSRCPPAAQRRPRHCRASSTRSVAQTKMPASIAK